MLSVLKRWIETMIQHQSDGYINRFDKYTKDLLFGKWFQHGFSPVFYDSIYKMLNELL